MSDSMEVQIADDIVLELNDPARSWTGSFTASREWAKIYSGSDLQTLQVKVVPLSIPAEAKLTRGGLEKFEYEIALDFAQSIPVANGTPDKPTIDTLSKLVQDVHDFYRTGHDLSTATPAKVMMATRPALFDEALLYNQNQWETTIMLVVRVNR